MEETFTFMIHPPDRGEKSKKNLAVRILHEMPLQMFQTNKKVWNMIFELAKGFNNHILST